MRSVVALAGLVPALVLGSVSGVADASIPPGETFDVSLFLTSNDSFSAFEFAGFVFGAAVGGVTTDGGLTVTADLSEAAGLYTLVVDVVSQSDIVPAGKTIFDFDGNVDVPVDTLFVNVTGLGIDGEIATETGSAVFTVGGTPVSNFLQISSSYQPATDTTTVSLLEGAFDNFPNPIDGLNITGVTITYAYTLVPEPSSAVGLLAAAAVLVRRRR